MERCPVCHTQNEALLCEKCGFDGSLNWEKLPTLAPIPEASAAVSQLRKDRSEDAPLEGVHEDPPEKALYEEAPEPEFHNVEEKPLINTALILTISLMVLALIFLAVVLRSRLWPEPPATQSTNPSHASVAPPETSIATTPDSDFMTYAEYVAAEIDTAVTVECYVQATQGWWEKDGQGVIPF